MINIRKHKTIPALYDGEKLTLKKLARLKKIIPEPEANDSDPLKKKRELFHAITFLSLTTDIELTTKNLSLPKDGEGADIEISGQHKRAIEITECFDGNNNHKKFKESLNNLLLGKKTIFDSINKLDGLKEAFPKRISSKNEKINHYRKEGYSTELLIVTDEAYENCPVTGSWIEKFLNEPEIATSISSFDQVYALIYHSSGKDSGPLVQKYPEDYHEYQRYMI